MRRGPAVFILICLLVATAYGAQRVLLGGVDRLTGFSPNHLTGVRPPAGPPALAQRLVIILAEGLRPEDARLLPTVDWLARRGAQVRLAVPQPGYAIPSAATLLTGARPEVHGVLFRDGVLRADNLLVAAKRAGMRTGGAGGADMGHFLRPAVDAWDVAGTPADLLEKAKPLLSPSGPRVVILHTHFLSGEIERLHTASRESADYRNALAQFDYTLVRLVEQVDWKSTALAVAGTVPTGETGSYVPGAPVSLVMAGPGIKPGYRGEASLMDMASTFSAIAGSPVPLPNEGQPLLGALDVTAGRPQELIVEQVLASRKAYSEGALAAMGSMAVVPEPPKSPASAGKYVTDLNQQLEETRFAAWREWGLEMAPYAGGALLLVLLYLFIVLRQPFGGAVVGGVLTYAAAFQIIFFATGGRYSGAMAGLEAPGRNEILLLAARSAVAMAITMMTTGYRFSRKGFKKRAYVAGAACHTALTTAMVTALPVAVVLGRTGLDFPVSLPGAGLIVWFFVTGLQVMVIGYLSPLWTAMAVSAAALSRQWWPLKEIGDPERNADKVVRMKALRARK